MRNLRLALACILVSAFVTGDRVTVSSASAEVRNELIDLSEGVKKLYDAAKYAEAINLAENEVKLTERRFGQHHPNVIPNLHDLATLYRLRGQYAAAEPVLWALLEVREKGLGLEHLSVAQSLDELGTLLRIRGRYADAEPLFRRALAIREDTVGSDSPDVCTSLTNLAVLYQTQDRYSDAEPLLKRSLAAREGKFGADHPSVGHTLHELARLYRKIGRDAEAAQFYDRALSIFGAKHPEAIIKAVSLLGTDKSPAIRRTFFGQLTELRWTGLRSDFGSDRLVLEGEAVHANALWQPFAVDMVFASGEWKMGRIHIIGLAWR